MNCFCKNLVQYDLCSGFVERRYLINFIAKKICLFEIPEYTQKEVMKLDFCLKEKTKSKFSKQFCKVFFRQPSL